MSTTPSAVVTTDQTKGFSMSDSSITIKLGHETALLDGPFTLNISGLGPATRTRIAARLTDDNGVQWQSEGIYYSDMDGALDPDCIPSVGGTYEGLGTAGLLWSMMPTQKDALLPFLNGIAEHPERTTTPVLNDFQPVTINIEVEADDSRKAATTFTQRAIDPDVEISDVDEPGVCGMYFCPPGPGPHPGVVVVPGSNGGMHTQSAALLASRGYAVLAMALYNYKSLPEKGENIPLEGYKNAVLWLRDKIGHDRIALRGGSRGAEGALLAAIHFPDLVKSVIAWVPTPMHLVATSAAPDAPVPLYTLDGAPLPYAITSFPLERLSEEHRFEAPFRPAPYFLSCWTDPENIDQYTMPFEQISVPLLLISGTADEMWPSAYAGSVIAAYMKEKNPNAVVDHVMNHGAGHTFHVPNVVESCSSATYHLINKMWLSTGGTPRMNAEAARRSWDRYLGFLETTLA